MLKKDILELCLLHLLTQGDQYGYEMLTRLHGVFPDTRESVIYAALRSLCKEGLTEKYEGETSAGPARKYYRVTDQGTARYGALLAQWRAMREAVDAMGIC